MLADEHDLLAIDPGQSRQDRAVIAEGMVAMQFNELVKNHLDVIHRLRTIRMTRDADGFPRTQAVVNLTGLALQLQSQLTDRLLQGLRRRWLTFELFDLCLQVEDRLLEREGSQCGHANQSSARPRRAGAARWTKRKPDGLRHRAGSVGFEV